EPVNVIKEDPTNENILYAGGLRGVYLSTNRGNSWSYLGTNMPAAAVADLEIHEASMDLVAATHGRGIYKINLKPIQKIVNQNLPVDKNHFFEIEQARRPWFNSSGGEPDYRTVEKVSFTYWLKQAKNVPLSVRDSTNKEVWSTTVNGKIGFNQFRWDMIVTRQESDSPYFIHYDKFIVAGTYVVRVSTGEENMEQPFTIVKMPSPYIEK
ncbi:MAG: hypothetical protein K2U26_19230, partial [Cyclobacteriaceae bacterium]|nr:hypothetical protein [Cyclobacteriaceae bacterium]